MSNSRLWLMGLGLALVLVVGGFTYISVSGSLLAVDATSLPSAATPDASNAGNTGGPRSPSESNGHAAPSGTEANPSNSADTTNQASQANPADNHTLYCPKQSELYKEEMFWHGPNTWRDYSASFVKNINNFAGAQWVGVNVGKIICLYKGLEENNFPIALERDNLMKKPEGENWKSDASGYKKCKSDSIMDCPFVPQEVKANENVYDFLSGIKKPK